MSFVKWLSVPIAAISVAVAAPAAAAEFRAFDARAFAAAQAQGRPIVVDVYADWCPVCRRQKGIIADVAKSPQHNKLVVFKLDFDKQKADWKRFGVRRQSTLIAFNGRKERGRLVASTNRAAISRLFRSTLK